MTSVRVHACVMALFMAMVMVIRSSSLQAKEMTVKALPQIAVQFGPAEIVHGPNNLIDGPFNTLSNESSLQAYVVNSSTQGYIGGSLETLRPTPGFAIEGGSDPSAFDYCGAWLNSAFQDSNVIRGWYHAEHECNYGQNLETHKSVGYAESYDGGLTFTKPNYPNNQVITAPVTNPSPDADDEGDHRVIRVGDYLYMYFLATEDWRIHLARSQTIDGGMPGTWQKYFQGQFNQPGLGGDSSPIPWESLARSWVSYNTYLKRYIGFGGFWGGNESEGYGFAFSDDGINWVASPYMAVTSTDEWLNRNENSEELIAYHSFISLYGNDDQLGDTFWMYYMYLNPGESFDQRYLLRRKIKMAYTSSTNPIDLVPHIALTQYSNGADTWITTVNTNPNYALESIVGYLFTANIPHSKPVYDCYIDIWDDHMISTIADCEETKYLRRLGWISEIEFPGSKLIYRCFDIVANNHFISSDPQCNGAVTEWPIGYLVTHDAITPNEFVALSGYYDESIDDNWVTTGVPAQSYEFEKRLGYLFASEVPNSKPVYDCFIDDWDDHMLGVEAEECPNSLGLMGWVSSEVFPDSIPLYRCFDTTTNNHSVSITGECNGLEWRIGYIAETPSDELFVWQSTYLPMVGR